MKINLDLSTIPDPRKKACDRCGLMDATVKERNDCDLCGPTLLCNDCHEIHLEDRNKL